MAKKFSAELADGSTLEVTPDIRDTLAAEAAFRKNKAWGTVSESPIRFGTYRIWYAAYRANLTDLTWIAFSEGENCCIDYHEVRDEEPADDLEETAAALGKDTTTAQPIS